MSSTSAVNDTAQSTIDPAKVATAQAVVQNAKEITGTVRFKNDPNIRIIPRINNNESNNESEGEESEGEESEEKPQLESDTKSNDEEPIIRKNIRIINKPFLVETNVEDVLTEEQELLYKHLYLPEFEGEEDEEWRHRVLQEVIDSCTSDFSITLGPQCDTFRSYLEKLAQKVFDEDQPILYEGEEEGKEEEGEKKKKRKQVKKEEEKEYEITITIDLAELHKLLLEIK